MVVAEGQDETQRQVNEPLAKDDQQDEHQHLPPACQDRQRIHQHADGDKEEHRKDIAKRDDFCSDLMAHIGFCR